MSMAFPDCGAAINDLLSGPSHPNRKGHEIAAKVLVELFGK